MSIISLDNCSPAVHESAYIAPTATVAAQVRLDEGVSVWPGASLRGDDGAIVVGKNSNIQDNAVVHCDPGDTVRIGENVSVGHGAILHGCTIADNCLIGMGAIVLNGAELGPNTLVAAGALIAPNKHFEGGVLLLGNPARVVRSLTDEEIGAIAANALHYAQQKIRYQKHARVIANDSI